MLEETLAVVEVSGVEVVSVIVSDGVGEGVYVTKTVVVTFTVEVTTDVTLTVATE